MPEGLNRNQIINEAVATAKNKVREKYFTGPKPESDLSEMGDIKIIDGIIYVIHKGYHAPRDHGYKNDQLWVLDKDAKNMLFQFSGEIYDKYENHYMGDPKKTYTKPEKEFKEILGLDGNKLKILTSDGQTIEVEIPENILSKMPANNESIGLKDELFKLLLEKKIKFALKDEEYLKSSMEVDEFLEKHPELEVEEGKIDKFIDSKFDYYFTHGRSPVNVANFLATYKQLNG